MRIVNLEQNSEDWLKWRRSGLGASDAPVLLGVSPWVTPGELWLEKRRVLGKVNKGTWEEQGENAAMKRGKKLEPNARSLFEALTGILCEPLCAMHDELDWMRASLDGYDPSTATILEIKCPNDKAHQGALHGEIPDYYVPQLIHQCLVAGVQKVAYVSYSPDRKWRGADRMALVEYTATRHELDLYLAAAQDFWQRILDGVPPE